MNKQQGMTLIELLVVMVVLGIIISVALPSYRNFILRANHSEAVTAMMSVSQDLERCFTRFSAYDNAGCVTATSLTGAGVTTETNKYTLTGVIAATTFTVTATPTFSDDPDCGNFTLTNAAQRGISGTGTVDKCW